MKERIQRLPFFYPSKIEQQADATPLGFFERISTCDASLRERQQQIHDRATASSDPAQLPPLLLLPPLGPVLEAMPMPMRQRNGHAQLRPGVHPRRLAGQLRTHDSPLADVVAAAGAAAEQPPCTSFSRASSSDCPCLSHGHRLWLQGEIMKRLQRETFRDVMWIIDKHKQIERIFSMYRNVKGFHFP